MSAKGRSGIKNGTFLVCDEQDADGVSGRLRFVKNLFTL